MVTIFIVAVLVVCALVFFMFFILKGTVKKINSQTKLYFVDKLQEYDYLIDQKEEKLNKINEELKEKETKREETGISTNKNTYEFDYQIIDLLNKTKYQDKNIFEINKQIDEKFQLDYIAILKKFIENIKENKTYEFCLELREKLTSEVIYNLKVMEIEEQRKYLEKILTENEYLIYLLYLNMGMNKYSVDGFIEYVNELIDLNNPNVLVYVGSKTENYDYLSNYIKTVYSKDIYKGIRIIYRKKIYDYSLNERNV